VETSIRISAHAQSALRGGAPFGPDETQVTSPGSVDAKVARSVSGSWLALRWTLGRAALARGEAFKSAWRSAGCAELGTRSLRFSAPEQPLWEIHESWDFKEL